MEKKKSTINEEIQLTLGCIHKIERVSINPWLPTRLREKLKNKASIQNRAQRIGNRDLHQYGCQICSSIVEV